jgi:hypothetical protein
MSLAFQKLNIFPLNLSNAGYNLGSDQLRVVLTDTAPTATVTSFAGEIAYTNFSGANPTYLTTTSNTQTSGVQKLIMANLTMTSIGTIPQWRYIGIYDQTTSKVIAWFDYGSEVNMLNTDTITFNFDATNGLLQIS